MNDIIRSVDDLTDEEIVRCMKGPQSAPGSYLCDPLEGQIVLATERAVIPESPKFFDDIRKRYRMIIVEKKRK